MRVVSIGNAPARLVLALATAWGLAGDAARPAGLAAQADDEETIRSVRAASNEAIARHDVDAFVSFLDEDFQVTAGNGTLLRGREAMREGFEDRLSLWSDLRYVRTPASVVVSATAPLAWESGDWVGTWTTAEGAVRAGGCYAAQWRQVDGAWKIRAELFVTLYCEGPGCATGRREASSVPCPS